MWLTSVFNSQLKLRAGRVDNIIPQYSDYIYYSNSSRGSYGSPADMVCASPLLQFSHSEVCPLIHGIQKNWHFYNEYEKCKILL